MGAGRVVRYAQPVARILVVDNFDSFVYNLAQYLGELGAEPVVRRPDEIDVAGVDDLRPAGLLISPGPGRPENATTSLQLIGALGERIPILGVCLGHQCIAVAHGATVVRAPVMHGKTSTIAHDGRGVFAGIPDPLVATRYHSLVVDPRPAGAGGHQPGPAGPGGHQSGPSGAPDLEVTAWSEDGTIMGLRHRRLAIEGVQFHPESILTDAGHRLIANWLEVCGQSGARAASVAADRRRRLPA